MTPPEQAAEALAKRRFIALNLVRIGSLAAVLLGIATANGVTPLPYLAGVALTLAGLAGFFFAPRQLARRWKSDSGSGGHED